MYTIDVEIEGVAPLLHHNFGALTQAALEQPAKKRTGAPDYSTEWKDTCYTDGNGNLVQPGIHLEMCMVKAATSFRIPGARGRTYKDLFSSSIFVRPDMLPHGIKVPEKPKVNKTDDPVYIDLRPVVVQRARVLRSRLAFAPGWKLKFQIDVQDDNIQLDVVQEVLTLAGQTVGIGDYRPRYGRFRIVHFDRAV